MSEADGLGGGADGDPPGGEPGESGAAAPDPTLAGKDVDAMFAQIVASFSVGAPQPGAAPWPSAEDLEGPTVPVNESTPPRRTADRHALRRTEDPSGLKPDARPLGRGSAADPPPTHRPLEAPLDHGIGMAEGLPLPRGLDPTEDDLDEDDRYVPPEPGPIGQGDLISRAAWGSVLGAPLFLLLCALLWRSLPAGILVACLVAFVAGFVILVARMPADPPEDDDDGAVV